MKIPTAFEIHYYLADGSHSMNAVLRNNAETEFLAIANEVISTFDLGIILEAEAWGEGGLRNRFRFISTPSYGNIVATVGAFTGIAALVYTTLPEKENFNWNDCIEMKRNMQDFPEDIPPQDMLDQCAKFMNRNSKIITRKSNYYKKLQKEEKINKVGFVGIDDTGDPVGNEATVLSSDFNKFILLTNKLDPEIIENAHIEITSPVIRESQAQWKGSYKERNINFSMRDKEFKNQVLRKEISFKNGDSINCILRINRELNEFGEEIISGYSVETVLDKIENNNIFTETASGKKRRSKKSHPSQANLFDNLS